MEHVPTDHAPTDRPPADHTSKERSIPEATPSGRERTGQVGSRPVDSLYEQARDDPGRRESEEERQDRNLQELLQELRVAALGIQVLFGFLLALPFSARFLKLDPSQRHLCVVSLVLSALATGLLVAPVAYHRMVFRKHKKERLVRMANVMAIAGLAVVALAISSSVLLVTSVVLAGVVVPVVTAAVAGMFALFWFVLPYVSSRVEAQEDR